MTSFAAELAERLVTRIPDALPEGTDPPAGASVGVAAAGLSEIAAAGVRLADGSEPMTPRTHHDLASVTKVAATVPAIMRLISERQMKLDDPVGKYLSPFTASEKADITVRDLLGHRGGLWEWQPLYLRATDPTEAIRVAAELPLRYEPGTERHYSDLGFMLLGEIVSLVSGMAIADAVSQLVTEPLGLVSTRFGHPAGPEVAASAYGDTAEQAMVATGEPYPVTFGATRFADWRHSPVIGEVNDGNAFHVFDGVAGHAGLFSTITDLLALATAFANFGRHESLWSADVVDEFFAEGPDAGQSLGFRRYRLDIGPDAVTVLGHTGFVGCAIGFVPERNIAVALASNRLLTHGTPVPGDRLWQTVLDATGRHMSESAGHSDSQKTI